jgi:FKBP-type peptidyl-prolyl cis-trans isomerase
MTKSASLILLALLAGTAACNRQPASSQASPSDASPSQGGSTQSGMSYAAQQRDYLAKLDQAQGWQSTPSGLRYRRIGGTGTGPKPSPTDTVTLHYIGSLTNGTVFDSSVERGEPVTMALQQLIPGWQEGVPLMSVGDRYEFAIPAELGYGSQDSGPIPADSTLLFTIGLMRIEPS